MDLSQDHRSIRHLYGATHQAINTENTPNICPAIEINHQYPNALSNRVFK